MPYVLAPDVELEPRKWSKLGTGVQNVFWPRFSAVLAILLLVNWLESNFQVLGWVFALLLGSRHCIGTPKSVRNLVFVAIICFGIAFPRFMPISYLKTGGKVIFRLWNESLPYV